MQKGLLARPTWIDEIPPLYYGCLRQKYGRKLGLLKHETDEDLLSIIKLALLDKDSRPQTQWDPERSSWATYCLLVARSILSHRVSYYKSLKHQISWQLGGAEDARLYL